MPGLEVAPVAWATIMAGGLPVLHVLIVIAQIQMVRVHTGRCVATV